MPKLVACYQATPSSHSSRGGRGLMQQQDNWTYTDTARYIWYFMIIIDKSAFGSHNTGCSVRLLLEARLYRTLPGARCSGFVSEADDRNTCRREVLGRVSLIGSWTTILTQHAENIENTTTIEQPEKNMGSPENFRCTSTQ